MKTYVRLFWLISILAFLGWAIWRIGYSLKSPIESVRIKCVEQMTDQYALADIALDSNEASLVKIARSKVTDPDVITTLLLRDVHFTMYGYGEFEKLDQKHIAAIAMDHKDAKCRAEGISHLTDQDSLAKVALTDAFDENRMRAFNRVVDAEALQRAAATGSALSKSRAEGLVILLLSIRKSVPEKELEWHSNILFGLLAVAAEPAFQACVGKLESLDIDYKQTSAEYYGQTVRGEDITVNISFVDTDQSPWRKRKELIHVETHFPDRISYSGKTPPDYWSPNPGFYGETKMAIMRLLNRLSHTQITELASSGASQTVRLYCIDNVTDTMLLKSLSRDDSDWMVREAAKSRLESIWRSSHK